MKNFKSLNLKICFQKYKQEINDLLQASNEFVSIYLLDKDDNRLPKLSIMGLRILTNLASTIRELQNQGFIGSTKPIGFYKQIDYLSLLQEKNSLKTANPLHLNEGLRFVLNKIIHCKKSESDFYVDGNTHRLILVDSYKGTWGVTAFDLKDLCNLIKSY